VAHGGVSRGLVGFAWYVYALVPREQFIGEADVVGVLDSVGRLCPPYLIVVRSRRDALGTVDPSGKPPSVGLKLPVVRPASKAAPATMSFSGNTFAREHLLQMRASICVHTGGPAEGSDLV